MSVTVTLEFKSADEAIVALGKLAGIKTSAAPAAGNSTGAPYAPAPVAAEPAKRKPRADKGQKRGEYKPRAEEANAVVEAGTKGSAVGSGTAAATGGVTESGSATSAGPSTVPPVAVAPDVAPPPAAGAAPTEAEVQAAVEKLYGEKGYDTTLAALSRYGVRRGKDLLPEHRANFIADVERILAGGAV